MLLCLLPMYTRRHSGDHSPYNLKRQHFSSPVPHHGSPPAVGFSPSVSRPGPRETQSTLIQHSPLSPQPSAPRMPPLWGENPRSSLQAYAKDKVSLRIMIIIHVMCSGFLFIQPGRLHSRSHGYTQTNRDHGKTSPSGIARVCNSTDAVSCCVSQLSGQMVELFEACQQQSTDLERKELCRAQLQREIQRLFPCM